MGQFLLLFDKTLLGVNNTKHITTIVHTRLISKHDHTITRSHDHTRHVAINNYQEEHATKKRTFHMRTRHRRYGTRPRCHQAGAVGVRARRRGAPPQHVKTSSHLTQGPRHCIGHNPAPCSSPRGQRAAARFRLRRRGRARPAAAPGGLCSPHQEGLHPQRPVGCPPPPRRCPDTHTGCTARKACSQTVRSSCSTCSGT